MVLLVNSVWVFLKIRSCPPLNKKSKKFNQQNTIFVKRGHTLLFSRYNCGNIKEECPRFTTPEFCPVTVLLPESLDTFSILPLRLLFSFYKKKVSPVTFIQITILNLIKVNMLYIRHKF
jgi:hypothetical protein